MFKQTLMVLAVVVMSQQASAADLVCSVPEANIARSVELCEELRLELGVRPSEWTNNVCATQFLRVGFLAFERKVSKRVARLMMANIVNDAVVTYEGTWAEPARAFCGDGVLDAERPFNEGCDDGNNFNGDGCDSQCVVE